MNDTCEHPRCGRTCWGRDPIGEDLLLCEMHARESVEDELQRNLPESLIKALDYRYRR